MNFKKGSIMSAAIVLIGTGAALVSEGVYIVGLGLVLGGVALIFAREKIKELEGVL